jgi:PAS domain S-box-containing protein
MTLDAGRQTLETVIAGLSQGVILVEPDGRIAWANRAAMAMHGVDAVAALGGDPAGYAERFALRYRNNHRLEPADYPLSRVLAGAFEPIVVEALRPGEGAEPLPARFQRAHGFPLPGGDGFVVVIDDVTGEFEAEERFERTFNANPAPAVICRLSDLRYVKVNLGFQEMTGHMAREMVGRTVYEVDVMERADQRELAIERLAEGRTIPQMEACLTLPGGGEKPVVVAGQPIEMGDQPCMLFTFMDLEPRRKAEDALRQSEARFATSFRLSPVPAAIATRAEGRFLEVNEAFVATFGWAADELVGRRASEIGLYDGAAGPALDGAGSLRNHEMRVRLRAGGALDCLVSAETVGIGGETCVLTVLQNITARKRSEEELVAAIEAVMQDTSWFSRTVIEKLANLRAQGRVGAGGGETPPGAALADLTAREREVLGLMVRGMADKEIARAVGLSLNTVRNHVRAVYGRIGVHKRSAAIVWARERGFTGV